MMHRLEEGTGGQEVMGREEREESLDIVDLGERMKDRKLEGGREVRKDDELN